MVSESTKDRGSKRNENNRFQYLLDDVKKRGMGIIFGKNSQAKEEASLFKQFAKEQEVSVHVILDERKNWAIVTEQTFQFVNESWKRFGRKEQLSY